jgi:hypothetical protein
MVLVILWEAHWGWSVTVGQGSVGVTGRTSGGAETSNSRPLALYPVLSRVRQR